MKKTVIKAIGRFAVVAGVAWLVAGQGAFAGDEEHTSSIDVAERDAFISMMVEKHDFDRAELEKLLGAAEYKQSIINAISRPAEKVLTWGEYRKIFMTEKRIRLGKKFLIDNAEQLAAAEKEFGVPPHIVTAVIGVETYYGGNKGSFLVVDSLSTLGFAYEPRAKFFRKQLEEFLLLAREQGLNPAELTGSYAGAMGYGQFIPSSYRAFAVDFDKDGVADIWNNTSDAVGSVANYFAEHKWRSGEPVVTRAEVPESIDETLFNVSLKPSTTLAVLAEKGVKPLDVPVSEAAVSPMKLEGDEGFEYWLGLDNFYVITRYNHSKLYAMAVYQLSEAIKAETQTVADASAGVATE